MKTNITSLATICLGLLLFSCDLHDHDVIPTSQITTTQASFSDYDALDVSTAFTVYVSFSDREESIEIEANENLHQYIEIKKVNNRLEIGLENNVSIRGNATLNAYITTQSISSFMASGATQIIVADEINENEIDIYLSGASKFTGTISTNTLFADISGASNMSVSGLAGDFLLDASGASSVRDYDFAAQYLQADLSGASNVYITVDNEIVVEASGASNLNFKGNAVITRQNLSGASSVRRM